MVAPRRSRGRFQVADAVVRAGANGRRGESDTAASRDRAPVPRRGGKIGGGNRRRLEDGVASNYSPNASTNAFSFFNPPTSEAKCFTLRIVATTSPVFV